MKEPKKEGNVKKVIRKEMPKEKPKPPNERFMFKKGKFGKPFGICGQREDILNEI